MRPYAALVLIALGAVWGSSFLFIKVILEEIPPTELVAARLALGTIAVLLIMAVRRPTLRWSPRLLAALAAAAVLSNVAPFALIAWAEQHIDSGVASVLNSTMPLFTSLFAAIILIEERFTPLRVAGLVAGFIGVITLTGGDILDVTDSNVLGKLAVVGAASCYAAGAVSFRILLRSEDPFNLAGIVLVIATTFAFAMTLGVEGVPDYTALSTKGWLALLALGLLGSGAAYVTYLWLVDNLGSVRASLVTYVVPAMGLLLGWSVLGEEIGANTLAGAALIVLGVAGVLRGEAPAPQRAPASTSADGS